MQTLHNAERLPQYITRTDSTRQLVNRPKHYKYRKQLPLELGNILHTHINFNVHYYSIYIIFNHNNEQYFTSPLLSDTAAAIDKHLQHLRTLAVGIERLIAIVAKHSRPIEVYDFSFVNCDLRSCSAYTKCVIEVTGICSNEAVLPENKGGGGAWVKVLYLFYKSVNL